MPARSRIYLWVLCIGSLCLPVGAQAFVIQFSDADFQETTVFSGVTTFSFRIDIAAPLTPGEFIDPALNAVVYSVSGSLANTPSGFPGFNLLRNIIGSEFYTQGSSLRFTIAAGADFNDGLQVSELVGADPVFVFDGREVGTGRYHPALFQLHSDGTGSIRNSNNQGGINPSSLEEVNVDFGEEYITNLTSDPSLTLAAAVPLPPAMVFMASAILLGAAVCRRTPLTA